MLVSPWLAVQNGSRAGKMGTAQHPVVQPAQLLCGRHVQGPLLQLQWLGQVAYCRSVAGYPCGLCCGFVALLVLHAPDVRTSMHGVWLVQQGCLVGQINLGGVPWSCDIYMTVKSSWAAEAVVVKLCR